MKKFFVSFALFAALIFVVSCSGGSKNNDSTDTTDSGETVTDEDAVDTDATDNEPTGDTTPDGGDTTHDGGDSTSDEDADSGATEQTESEKCVAAGGTYIVSESGETCTKITKCQNKPKHAEWNGESSYTQTYADGKWSAETATEHNDTAGTCRFKCRANYVWRENICQSKFPVCNTDTVSFPCIDPETDYIWSHRSNDKSWNDAVSYCESLNTNKYGGFDSGWHLPNISELRTIVLNENLKTGGLCGVVDNGSEVCLDYSSCFTDEVCVSEGKQSYGKLDNDNDFVGLWSSSYVNDSYVWCMVLSSAAAGIVYSSDFDISNAVRCVRNSATQITGCAAVGGIWDETEEQCTRPCSAKPVHTVWNGDGAYPATYSNGAWSAEKATEHNDTAGTCHYKCAENYFWDESTSTCVTPCGQCGNDENIAGCSATSLTVYTCECKAGSTWNASESKCLVDPNNLPECSAESAKPCIDSSTNDKYIWSAKSGSEMKWKDADGSGNDIYPAKSYCENLTEAGFSDWRLPNISELRTLIKDCSGTQMPGGTCGVIDTGTSSTSCLEDNCWKESDCASCSDDLTGGHSKFGETGWFWSSSIKSDTSDYVWFVDFGNGMVLGNIIGNSNNVRCVR